MRVLVRAASVVVFVGSLVLVRSAVAAQPGCVDLLVDCDASSPLLATICGAGPHDLSQIPTNLGHGGTVAQNISFVVFGANVQSVTLTRCAAGGTTVITGDTNLCEVADANDNVCQIELATPAPSLNSFGLALLLLMLLAVGVHRSRRRAC